jgi:hypothetical protein
MTPDSAKKYEITENRKSHLLKLRKYLNEVLLDQIPPLAGLLKQLEFLSMQQCNTLQQKNPYMVQQIPEIRNKILEGRDWLEIAQFQKENFWSADQHKDKREFDLLLELTEVYGNEAVDTIVDGFTCPNCNKTAIQRCSRCKSEWYCGKACQVIFFLMIYRLSIIRVSIRRSARSGRRSIRRISRGTRKIRMRKMLSRPKLKMWSFWSKSVTAMRQVRLGTLKKLSPKSISIS